MAAVSIVNLVIHKGTDFEENFYFTEEDGSPLNLTGYTGSAKIRKHPTATKYNIFTITFVDRAKGNLKVSMGSSVTSNLNSGRNCYDILLTDNFGKVSKVIEGSVIVNDSVTLGKTNSQNIDGLGNIDVTNVQDGYVLMYDAQLQKYIFVNPDTLLSKAVADNVLPSDFIDKLDRDLDDRINLDSGEFTP